MKYIDVKEASERWGISDRRIRLLCNEGRIDGAIKLGWAWTIPEDTPKPRDGRVLRPFKNLDIRAGFIDQENLDRLVSSSAPLEDFTHSDMFDRLCSSTLEFLLERQGSAIPASLIDSVLSGKKVDELSLKDHLAILNFRSCLLMLSRSREKWTEKSVRLLHERLMQGIDDYTSYDYREGKCEYSLRGKERYEVAPQMESIFTQYETWAQLNPVIRGVMLFGEVKRCRPFEAHPELLDYLVLSGELMAYGIRPPFFRREDGENASNAAFIALSRGNYRDLTSFIEEAVVRSYMEGIGNVRSLD